MSRLGTFLFGSTEFLRRVLTRTRRVSCVGDRATHPGSIITSGQSGNKLYVAGLEVAVEGSIFNCSKHGMQTISPVISRTKRGGSLLITDGAVVGCGARIRSPDRKVYAG